MHHFRDIIKLECRDWMCRKLETDTLLAVAGTNLCISVEALNT